MQRSFLITLVFVLLLANLQGQDSLPLNSHWNITGYLKSLSSLNSPGDLKKWSGDELLHHRLNIRWQPVPHFTAGAELRNRLFWGNAVSTTPSFFSQLRNNRELVKISVDWFRAETVALHSQVDRLWAEYQNEKWSLRLGRQRINWGQTTSWNPNDIFNTYNFLDFDYEERPGTDAVKLDYRPSAFSNSSWVVAPGRSIHSSIAAYKYSFNRSGYDWQALAGWYIGQLTIGTGWAGSIADAGFKGELQYYFRNDKLPDHFTTTLETDYAFPKGWYGNISLLYNSRGTTRPLPSGLTPALQFSPKNLMPTRWNGLVTVTKSFSPLLNGTLSVLYAPGMNLVFILPGLTYNLSPNWDLDWVWQSFFASSEKNWEDRLHRMYVRVKWSY